MKSVCIVGAGPAGLVGAKILLGTKQFTVTILERGDRIGGIWALDENSKDGYLGPSTPTNLSRFTVAFSDLDWKSIDLSSGKHGEEAKQNVPMFPKAWHVNRYLETYRQQHIPEKTILFGREVMQTQRHTDATGTVKWIVTSRDEDGRNDTKEYDHLMLASGFFSQPRPLPFSRPRVTTVHSSRYRSLEDLFPSSEHAAGKKILMIE